VLVKGGHLPAMGGVATDVFVTADESVRLEHAYVPGADPRGTGCALAAAIAVELGRGRNLQAAVGTAGTWLGELIAG
jgi:hydroxymethylpyrimidine/phosphomethylpyrimidine kinase